MTVLAKPLNPSCPPKVSDTKAALETARLRLNGLHQDDLLALHDVFNDPVAAKMAHDVAWPFSLRAAEDRLTALMDNPKNSWAIRLKDGPLVGVISLSAQACGQSGRLNDFGPNISLYVAPTYRGHGYGTEALEAVLHYLKTERGLKVVQAAHFSDNEDSGHTLIRAGMLYTGRRTYESSLARTQRCEVRHMIMFL